MSIKIIDRFDGFAILKITRPNGTVVYQTMPAEAVGKDGSKSKQHDTLAEARIHLGMGRKVTTETKPKASYAQNQKGYDPHRVR